MSSIATTTPLEDFTTDDGYSASAMRNIPEELLRQILSDTRDGKGPYGSILISDTGDKQRKLLTTPGISTSLVCRRFRDAIRATGIPGTFGLTLPTTHVYRGDFKFLFDLESQDVQSRIDWLADYHKWTETTRPFCCGGWGRDRYEDFVNSAKNNIRTLVIPMVRSSRSDASEADNRALSACHADTACIGLDELSHWAFYARRTMDKRLLPNLRHIILPGEEWKLAVDDEDVGMVDTRSTPSSATTPTEQLWTATRKLQHWLNLGRPRDQRVRITQGVGRSKSEGERRKRKRRSSDQNADSIYPSYASSLMHGHHQA